jgi:hypothetical protein
MVYTIVRHELDGRIGKDACKGSRVSLEEAAHTGVAIDVASRAEHARPCSRVRAEVWVGGLKEDLNAVERRDHGFRLGQRRRSSGEDELNTMKLWLRTTQPAMPPASPERRMASRLPSFEGIERRQPDAAKGGRKVTSAPRPAHRRVLCRLRMPRTRSRAAVDVHRLDVRRTMRDYKIHDSQRLPECSS